MDIPKNIMLSVAISLSLGLSACGNDDDPMSITKPVDATYRVTVTNLTNGQPLTPLAVVIHESGYDSWKLGAPASPGLEVLAESGNPADFLAESMANNKVIDSAASNNGPFGPGAQESVNMTVTYSAGMQLSIAAMLANTNDAFTGVKNWTIGGLAVGESATILAMVYDAGTEKNTETSATMPGPAAGGEGFNSTRDDIIDVITIHSGVVSTDDGLTGSALNESHRWQNKAAKIVVQRTN